MSSSFMMLRCRGPHLADKVRCSAPALHHFLNGSPIRHRHGVRKNPDNINRTSTSFAASPGRQLPLQSLRERRNLFPRSCLERGPSVQRPHGFAPRMSGGGGRRDPHHPIHFRQWRDPRLCPPLIRVGGRSWPSARVCGISAGSGDRATLPTPRPAAKTPELSWPAVLQADTALLYERWPPRYAAKVYQMGVGRGGGPRVSGPHDRPSRGRCSGLPDLPQREDIEPWRRSSASTSAPPTPASPLWKARPRGSSRTPRACAPLPRSLPSRTTASASWASRPSARPSPTPNAPFSRSSA